MNKNIRDASKDEFWKTVYDKLEENSVLVLECISNYAGVTNEFLLENPMEVKLVISYLKSQSRILIELSPKIVYEGLFSLEEIKKYSNIKGRYYSFSCFLKSNSDYNFTNIWYCRSLDNVLLETEKDWQELLNENIYIYEDPLWYNCKYDGLIPNENNLLKYGAY